MMTLQSKGFCPLECRGGVRGAGGHMPRGAEVPKLGFWINNKEETIVALHITQQQRMARNYQSITRLLLLLLMCFIPKISKFCYQSSTNSIKECAIIFQLNRKILIRKFQLITASKFDKVLVSNSSWGNFELMMMKNKDA